MVNFWCKNIDVCILINMLIEYKEENADSIKIRPSSLGSSDQLLLTWTGLVFNPLSPKSDQHQISPCNINAL